MLKQLGLADRLNEEARAKLLERIKQMEHEGYELEAAEGTFELLAREALHPDLRFFEVESYDVATRTAGAAASRTTAAVTLLVRDEAISETAMGHGPFNALHLCLRKCLAKLYPQIAEVHLKDYKVRVLDSYKGTAANVRVLIEWSDHRKSWSTVGVSDNVIEASWKALVDAIRLELMRLTEKDGASGGPVEG
jgi:2-isopropylmalate synthase